MILMLPKRIEENNIFEFLVQLGCFNKYDSITIDCANLRYFELIPMTAMLGKVYQWTQSGKSVAIRFNENSRPFPYMQRMNFFNHCGIKVEEHFIQDNSIGRFVEFNRIGVGGSSNSGKIANDIATCLAPDQAEETDLDKTGFFDSVEYCVSELMLNVIQHSRGAGFIGAQCYPSKGITQIAITDSGIGVRESFTQNHSPYMRKISNDLDALSLAMKAGVSSKSHISDPWGGGCENAGVGLTILRDIAIASGGSFNLVSGVAAIINDNESCFQNDCSFGGTYASFSFVNSKLSNFSDYLEQAKRNLGISNDSLSWEDEIDDWLTEYK